MFQPIVAVNDIAAPVELLFCIHREHEPAAETGGEPGSRRLWRWLEYRFVHAVPVPGLQSQAADSPNSLSGSSRGAIGPLVAGQERQLEQQGVVHSFQQPAGGSGLA